MYQGELKARDTNGSIFCVRFEHDREDGSEHTDKLTDWLKEQDHVTERTFEEALITFWPGRLNDIEVVHTEVEDGQIVCDNCGEGTDWFWLHRIHCMAES